MTEYHYGGSGIMADYARGGGGFLLCFLPLVLAEPGSVVGTILGLLAVLFAGFLCRTWRRQHMKIDADDEAVRAIGPFGHEIFWHDLTALKLSYYSTKRDKVGGWMQLVLKGGGGKALKVDSSLEGFGEVVERAVACARRRGIELSPATVQNLESLGYGPAAPGGEAP
jgi:hypothetical protein